MSSPRWPLSSASTISRFRGGSFIASAREVTRIEVIDYRSKGRQNKRVEFFLR
jgi:hypothetical protein